MPSLDVCLNGDGCWPDAEAIRDLGLLIDDSVDPAGMGLALLPGGMASGKAAVMVRVTLRDGRTLITQTSFALLESAVLAMRARLDMITESN